jgi:hypothetical protein
VSSIDLSVSSVFSWKLFENPENDPSGVDLESTLLPVFIATQALICNFPSLKSFSMEAIGLATLSLALGA